MKVKIVYIPLLNYVLFSITVFLGSGLSAQNREYDDEELSPKYKYELGVQFGTTVFLGDLGGRIGVGKDFAKDLVFKTTRLLAGVSVNYYPSHWYNVIAGINYTQVVGADSLVKNQKGAERWRYNRNLSFKSSILEAYLGAEVLILPAIDKSFATGRLSPYAGLGIGWFHFNPKAEYNNKWVNLRPLRLEGQGFPEYPDRKVYSLNQIYFPITLGLRYAINPTYSLSAGMVFRYTTTDYMDDVATTYIDPVLFDKYLPVGEAVLAKALYARSKTPLKVKPGVDRADRDGNKNDSYTSFFLSLRIVFKQKSTYYIGYW